MFAKALRAGLFSVTAVVVLWTGGAACAQGLDSSYSPPPSSDMPPAAPPPVPSAVPPTFAGSGAPPSSAPSYFAPPAAMGNSAMQAPGPMPAAPGQMPAPLESDPTFNDGPPPPGGPFLPGGPMNGPLPGPPGPGQPEPPFGPPGYPEPRAYVPPVYVPPPGPLLLPSFSPDATRFWLRSEYLVWWTKDAPLPVPLATTGSASDPVPGALGQPNTDVLYGGGSVGLGPASGWRLDLGLWLDHDQRFGVQAGFFILQRQGSGFDAWSDDNGNPVLARPVINANGGAQTAYVDALPGTVAGGMTIFNTSQFFGYDINGLANIFQSDRFRLDGIFGFRYLHLGESLEIDDQLVPLVPGALTFLGNPVDTSSTMVDFDRFETTNNFYGGQVGTKMEWIFGRWSLDLTSKIALGATQERTVVSGATTVFPAAGPGTSAPGGILATTANIGNYYQSEFAVVPEADLNLNFAITPRLSARVGYSFIWWSNVVRPGDQVNPVVSPNLIPSDVSYGQAGPNQPQYQFHTTSYWAQGLNLGLDFHF